MTDIARDLFARTAANAIQHYFSVWHDSIEIDISLDVWQLGMLFWHKVTQNCLDIITNAIFQQY